MAVSDWSTTAGSNTTIDGVNIGEGCPPGNQNDASRSIMAAVRSFYDSFTSLSTTVSGKLSASGAVFTGTQPTYTSEGAYLHYASSSNTSGKISVLTDGSPLPTSPANGDMVFYYTP